MSENKHTMIRLRIKEIAEERHIAMGKLSRLSDVSFNTIKRIFRDPYYSINTNTLDKIARALDVPANELMVQEDEPPTSS